MATLVAYYSRTGTTEKVAQAIARQLNAKIERIEDVKGRSGFIGWLRSGKEGMKKTVVKIKPVKEDPSKYGLVVVGTPVWSGALSSPVRAYLMQNKFKRVAFFCTAGSNDNHVFPDIEAIVGRPVATMQIGKKERKAGSTEKKIEAFVKSLR